MNPGVLCNGDWVFVFDVGFDERDREILSYRVFFCDISFHIDRMRDKSELVHSNSSGARRLIQNPDLWFPIQLLEFLKVVLRRQELRGLAQQSD